MLLALRLALSLLTVLPMRASGTAPSVAARAISLAPVVGALLGGAAAAVLAGLSWLGVPGLLAGVLVIGMLVLLTRGMHLDGLADTVDGLGCYGPPERALSVMREGGVGAFAVITLVLVLGVQTVSVATVAGARLAAVPLAIASGRAAFTWCCRRGVPAARPGGLGALVAGSQPVAVPVLWWLLLAGTGTFAVPGRPWLGPLAVLMSAAAVALLCRHACRRFGGITGDVLGAACELATTVVLVVCSVSPGPV